MDEKVLVSAACILRLFIFRISSQTSEFLVSLFWSDCEFTSNTLQLSFYDSYLCTNFFLRPTILVVNKWSLWSLRSFRLSTYLLHYELIHCYELRQMTTDTKVLDKQSRSRKRCSHAMIKHKREKERLFKGDRDKCGPAIRNIFHCLWTTPAIRQQLSAIVGHYRLYCWAIRQS